MGNQISSKVIEASNEYESDKDVVDLLDIIFTNFILKMDIDSMQNLQSTDYCDQLTIVTQDLLNNEFSTVQINQVKNRIENGVDSTKSILNKLTSMFQSNINSEEQQQQQEKIPLTSSSSSNQSKENEKKIKKSFFLPNIQVSNYNSNFNESSSSSETSIFSSFMPTTNDSTKNEETTNNNENENVQVALENPTHLIKEEEKEKICQSVAKFYIKIAHLYASILKALNPRFVVEDEITKKKTYYPFTYPRDKLPPNAKIQSQEDGFCVQRIRKLMQWKPMSTKPDTNTKEKKNIISISKNKIINDENDYNYQSEEDNDNENESEILTKENEIVEINPDGFGVEELTQLYYDHYDIDGSPSMSSMNEAQYKQDLLNFYKAFYQQPELKVLPESIKSFRDIKLKSYQPIEFSIMPAQTPETTSLLQDYATILREMISFTKSQHTKLKEILNSIFFVSLKEKNEKNILVRIHPKLTQESLEKITITTRQLLIELFYKCEDYFQTALQIYEALMETKILDSEFNNLFST